LSKKVVSLENIKNIKKLEFEMPSSIGVKLLVGTNGTGKTTLLVAMAKIGLPNAFRDNFKILLTSIPSIINPYLNAKVKYEVGENELIYTKKEGKWVPNPSKKVNETMKLFNYSTIQYIKADASRIQSLTSEIWHGKYNDIGYAEKIGEILENDKFITMVGVKLHGGRISPLIKLGTNNFYSDTYFSTGELCVFNIVKVVENSKRNSLILIDEVDMSLHPKVQLRLLKYLQESAKQKELTVIISTHSVLMIKQVERKDIYYLEDTKKDGFINVINPCYHTYALKGITIADDLDLEYVFLVEDDKAKILLNEMIEKFIKLRKSRKPILRILPIGGWNNVIKFYDENRGVVGGKRTKVFAFLDEDARASINQSDFYTELLEEHKQNIKFLPITPEKGLLKFIKEEYDYISDSLGLTKDFRQILNKDQDPKLSFKELIDSFSENLSDENKIIERKIFKFYTHKRLLDPYLLQTFGPLIN
jgi:energy-coupling factor transporter ATP-binding protein EcfA2